MTKKQTIIIAILAFIAGVAICTVSMAVLLTASYTHYKNSFEQALMEVERQEMRLANGNK